MNKTITKLLLALCLICSAGNAFAQHRYYCEVKGIEKDLSSGLKIISAFITVMGKELMPMRMPPMPQNWQSSPMHIRAPRPQRSRSCWAMHTAVHLC